MRYLFSEETTTYAAAIFPTGHTVTVQVLDLRSDALLSLTTPNTSESPHIAGVYRWSFNNLSATPTVKLDMLIVFTDTTTGRQRMGRYTFGGLPDAVVDNIATLQASVDALNDISVADILAAVLTSGDTLNAALSRLDNIDADVATNIPALIAALNDITVAEILAAITTGGDSVNVALSRLNNIDADVATNIPADIAALNNIAVADILAAALVSGDTVDQALSRLDNIDVSVTTTIPNAVAALNDISVAQVWAFVAASGDTANAAISRLDNIDVSVTTTIINAISALNDIAVADILSAVLTSTDSVNAALSRLKQLDDLVQGGRSIDFTGNDALGWQRVERDTAGSEIRRYNLFDEGGARITGTVAAFIAATKMISSEVAI